MKNINFVLSVGSVDGVCTSAAVLRNANPEANVEFCQAFTVNKVQPKNWGKDLNVIFVDLAVNNRDLQMTVDFLRRVTEAGHTIVGVLDEHNAEEWQVAFESAELSFESLTIKPVSQRDGKIKSSGALLISLLEDADEQTRELCEAADAGDRMDFSTHFGGIVNQAVKSKITDDSRRVYLAKYFAEKHDPDETINGWIAEYEAILTTHEEIIKNREDLGDDIVRVSAAGRVVDKTTLMKSVYDLGYSVAIIEGEMFNKSLNKKTLQISFECTPKLKIDLIKAIQATDIHCTGFPQKVTVEPEDEVVAISAVRNTLKVLRIAEH